MAETGICRQEPDLGPKWNRPMDVDAGGIAVLNRILEGRLKHCGPGAAQMISTAAVPIWHLKISPGG